MLVRLDHIARFHLDELGASDFYLYINPPVCLIVRSLQRTYHSRRSCFPKNVLGGTTASHTCLVWGAVIF